MSEEAEQSVKQILVDAITPVLRAKELRWARALLEIHSRPDNMSIETRVMLEQARKITREQDERP